MKNEQKNASAFNGRYVYNEKTGNSEWQETVRLSNHNWARQKKQPGNVHPFSIFGGDLYYEAGCATMDDMVSFLATWEDMDDVDLTIVDDRVIIFRTYPEGK